jgi:ribosomal protein L39E
MNFLRRLLFGRPSAKDSGLPRTEAGAAERVRLNRSGEADRRVPATQMMKKGGKVSSGYRKAADGCAQRGKTRGKMV